jgi:hypothetical protein
MTTTQPSDALSAAGIASWRRGGERLAGRAVFGGILEEG